MSNIIQSIFLYIVHIHLLYRFSPLCTKHLRRINQNVADLLLLHKSQETAGTISIVGAFTPGKRSINNHENALPVDLPVTGGFAGLHSQQGEGILHAASNVLFFTAFRPTI
jgi:hypothetical protein